MQIDVSRVSPKGVGPVVVTLNDGTTFDANFRLDPAGYDHDLTDINAAASKSERRRDARRGFRGRRGACRIARMPDTIALTLIAERIAFMVG